VNYSDLKSRKEEMCALICQLQGVIGADISFNGQDEIQEIHVVANFDRLPKQIVRDIESILFTRHGLRLDHKKVSIAQIKGEEVPPKRTSSRIQFVRVGVSVSGFMHRVEVELSKDGIPSLGITEGPSSEISQLRLIVEATLKAIRNYLTSDHTFVFDSVKSVSDEKSIILVTLTALTSRDERRLVGSALCEGDRNRTVVFATLDALNRYLERVLTFREHVIE